MQRKERPVLKVMSVLLAACIGCSTLPMAASAEGTPGQTVVSKTSDGYSLTNGTFSVNIGKYGQISSLKIANDSHDTDYVLNPTSAPQQAAAATHEWMGELMLATKQGDAQNYTEAYTSQSDSIRKVEQKGDNAVTVTYSGNATEGKGIKGYEVVETYTLQNGKLQWDTEIHNTGSQTLTVGDFGMPLAFNEIWPGGEVYENQVVYHSFVGQDSSYVYASRPSGDTPFLLLTPDPSTGAGFEYQDHWCTSERSADEAMWCQDQGGWANGLNVFYVHSDNIKKTNRGYLPNTKLVLNSNESKKYTFNFSTSTGEDDMRSQLYQNHLVDAVAVPSTVVTTDTTAKVDLHTDCSKDDITAEIKCIHDLKLYANHQNTVDTTAAQPCTKEKGTEIKYSNTVTDASGQKHNIYTLKLSCLGQNNVIIHYKENGQDKVTTLQFYVMSPIGDALEAHSQFMVNSTQWDANGKFYDKIFDDWNMDTKAKEAHWNGGWGDDWGPTKAEFLAEKNVYQPKANQIQALDQYLDVAIWNNLMQEHQEDGVIHNWIAEAPNTQRNERGYSYAHFFNTFFSMYKIASRYPDMITYTEKADTYLMRCYLIMKQLYTADVAYNYGAGLMGEMTVPEIITALKKEGHYAEAKNVTGWMEKKYQSFKDQKYPYGSEYAYDNTGEEAVYTLAKLNLAGDSTNAASMLEKIDRKTRICRGLQPVWYHYGNPTTICGENWWNFQYSASLAGYCMDDYLRLESNGWDANTLAEKERVNYAGKLADLTCINNGQIDASSENIGATAWSYQSELGNVPKTTWDTTKLHNGWRGWSGESDLGLFGVVKIMSSDVVTADPIFGLVGYGCDAAANGSSYTVTPKDGLNTKLNFIQQKLSIELNRDQYTQAVVDPTANTVQLSVKNLENSAHTSDISFTGLKAGNYSVKVAGVQTASFQSVAGKTATVAVALPKSAAAEVSVEPAAAPENKAPTAEAGSNQTVELSDTISLHGSATDDGYPNDTLSYQWTQQSSTTGGTATFANADQAVTKVSVDKAGTYDFKLTVSDGKLSGEDTVTLTVNEDTALPEVVANYTFETIQDNRDVDYIPDTSTAKNDAIRVRANLDDAGKSGKALKMDGTVSGGYVKLPSTVTKRFTDSTITGAYYLNAAQQSGTHLFEFGDMNAHYLYVSADSSGKLTLSATDLTTGEQKNAASDFSLATGAWVQLTVTCSGKAVMLYVNGNEAGKLENIDFSLGKLGEVQRNFIGRSHEESDPFLNGRVDNFEIMSKALTKEEVAEQYVVADGDAVSAQAVTVVTRAGTAPVLPQNVNVTYSSGIVKATAVVWDQVDSASYQTKGAKFTVNGTAGAVTATATVIVVSGDEQNVALDATANAQEFEDDLGTAAKMNDGFDPSNSADTTHGLWHNWNHNQNNDTWVEYDWPSAVVLTGMDMYYHQNNGNFIPVNVRVQYKNTDGQWLSASNCKGLGNAVDQYNKTTFDPVQTTALRVTMTPKQHSVGVIEWKVYGYGTRDANISALNKAIDTAGSRTESFFTQKSWSGLQTALTAANQVKQDMSASQTAVDTAAERLKKAIGALEPKDGNYALSADVAVDSTNVYAVAGAKEKIHDNSIANSSDPSASWNNWGQNKDGQVTYTWMSPVAISSFQLYFFSDGAGVQVPDTYDFEYLDSQGKWQSIACDTSGKKLDAYNEIKLGKTVSTTSIRVNLKWMAKPKTDQGGVGLCEWRVLGKADATPQKPSNVPSTTPSSTSVVDTSGTKITVSASNNNLTGSTLTSASVSANSSALAKLPAQANKNHFVSYNMNLTNSSHQEIGAGQTVKLSIPLPEALQNEKIGVWAEDKNGTVKQITQIQKKDGTVEFEAVCPLHIFTVAKLRDLSVPSASFEDTITVYPGQTLSFDVFSDKNVQLCQGDGSVSSVNAPSEKWNSARQQSKWSVYGICASKRSSEETGIYALVNGVKTKLFTVKINPNRPLSCDTSKDVAKHLGGSYTALVKVKFGTKVNYVSGNSKVLATFVKGGMKPAKTEKGLDYYYLGCKAVGSGSAGLYVTVGDAQFCIYRVNVK